MWLITLMACAGLAPLNSVGSDTGLITETDTGVPPDSESEVDSTPPVDTEPEEPEEDPLDGNYSGTIELNLYATGSLLGQVLTGGEPIDKDCEGNVYISVDTSATPPITGNYTCTWQHADFSEIAEWLLIGMDPLSGQIDGNLGLSGTVSGTRRIQFNDGGDFNKITGWNGQVDAAGGIQGTFTFSETKFLPPSSTQITGSFDLAKN